jgi:hypothetical protein
VNKNLFSIFTYYESIALLSIEPLDLSTLAPPGWSGTRYDRPKRYASRPYTLQQAATQQGEEDDSIYL